MLRNRSRAVTSKQALMADHSSQQPSAATQKRTNPIPSFFGSPRFRAFTAKGLHETHEAAVMTMSPTSILETIPVSPFVNHFSHQPNKSPKNFSENKHSWDKMDSKGIGLALIDTLNDDSIEKNSCKSSNNGKVLFGTKLRVQIPPLPPFTVLSPTESPKSPADFGIKTRNSQLSAFGSANSGIQTKDSPGKVVVTDSISVSEMELSEDYTCVISHGPVPRTTHIFDNCIVESYCSLPEKANSMLDNFLSYCYTCKKNLEQTKDIYMYRGEKAFCSGECRYQEMLLDGVENSEFPDVHRNFS